MGIEGICITKKMDNYIFIGIVGGRNCPDRDGVYKFLDKVFKKYPNAIIVSGGCPTGVDSFVYDYCVSNGYDIIVCGAGWDKHGKAGGPMRNSRIVKICDKLAAWWDGRSVGTRDVIEKAQAAGIEVFITKYI